MKNELHYIVVLRAIACSLVVLAHSIIYVKSLTLFTEQLQIDYFTMYFGAIGVDIFFVLSGFILLYANHNSKKSVQNFWLGRFNRIYPTYLVVLIISLLIGILKLYAGKPFYEIDVVIKSFFLYTNISDDGHVNNPIGVSWTLSYEIYFYILLGLVWQLKTEMKVVVISCLFFLVNWVCLLIQSPNNFLTNSIVYEFSLGMICYLIYRYVKLNRATGVIFCILAMVWIAVLYFLEWHGYEEKLIEYRWFILGMPSSLLLLGLINLPPALINNGIYRIGEGSYSIYLTHFTISLPFVGILSRVGQYVFAPYSLSIYWAWPLIGICVVLSCGIGLLFHRYIELRFARKNIFSM